MKINTQAVPIKQIARIFRLKDEIKILRIAKFENGVWGTWSKRLNKHTLERTELKSYYSEHTMMHYITMFMEIHGNTIDLREPDEILESI